VQRDNGRFWLTISSWSLRRIKNSHHIGSKTVRTGIDNQPTNDLYALVRKVKILDPRSKLVAPTMAQFTEQAQLTVEIDETGLHFGRYLLHNGAAIRDNGNHLSFAIEYPMDSRLSDLQRGRRGNRTRY
jgi:hypothetical protein